MEAELAKQGKALDQVLVEEMEALWQKAKSEVAKK
jgi:hypothetical protein